jgi:hypothetical protein
VLKASSSYFGWDSDSPGWQEGREKNLGLKNYTKSDTLSHYVLRLILGFILKGRFIDKDTFNVYL